MKANTIKQATDAELRQYICHELNIADSDLKTDGNYLHKIAQQYTNNNQYTQAFAVLELGYRTGHLDHGFKQAELLRDGYVSYSDNDTDNALQALGQFKQLAYKNHLKAMLEVARAYDGKDEEKNYPGIFNTQTENPTFWYSQIIKLSEQDHELNALAKFALARIQHDEAGLYQGRFDADSMQQRAHLYEQAQNYFTELANKGNDEAALRAGLMYYNREGKLIADPDNKNSIDFTKNNQTASNYFYQATRSQDSYTKSAAYLHIGMLYQHGYSPYKKDPREAERQYLKSSSSAGYFKIGEMYELGWEGHNNSIPKDLETAYKYYELAFRYSIPLVFSLYEDAKYYRQSGQHTIYSQFTVHQSNEDHTAWRDEQMEASQLSTEALRGKVEKANELMSADNQASVQQGLSLMKYCADKGFVSAQYYLGIYSLKQQSNNAQQYGLDLLSQAATNGHPHAQFAVGQHYYNKHLNDQALNKQNVNFQGANAQERLQNRDLGTAISYMKKAAQSPRVVALTTPAEQKSNDQSKSKRLGGHQRPNNKVTTLSDCSNDATQKPNNNNSSSNLFFSGGGRKLGSSNPNQQNEEDDKLDEDNNHTPGNN